MTRKAAVVDESFCIKVCLFSKRLLFLFRSNKDDKYLGNGYSEILIGASFDLLKDKNFISRLFKNLSRSIIVIFK